MRVTATWFFYPHASVIHHEWEVEINKQQPPVRGVTSINSQPQSCRCRSRATPAALVKKTKKAADWPNSSNGWRARVASQFGIAARGFYACTLYAVITLSSSAAAATTTTRTTPWKGSARHGMKATLSTLIIVTWIAKNRCCLDVRCLYNLHPPIEIVLNFLHNDQYYLIIFQRSSYVVKKSFCRAPSVLDFLIYKYIIFFCIYTYIYIERGWF